MILYLFCQAGLILFNLFNVKIDAYRILKNKRIAHGVNFGVYALFVAILCLITRWNVGVVTLFSVSAFFNRQLSFDIPLNLRRGLKWDYVSTARPPKAIMDRIEIWLFGYNGRAPVYMYAAGWVVCLVIKMLL